MGETEKEMWQNLQGFLRTKLRIPTSEISETDITSIRRVRIGKGRGRPPVGEVIVVFVDVDTRDRVCLYARNLSQFVDGAGKPTASVRMYIPTHLGGIHKVLMQYGYNMREKYGPEFKRNIRFDDAETTLCIDIKIPNTNPSQSKWITVDYERALADRRTIAKSTVLNYGDALSSGPGSQDASHAMDDVEVVKSGRGQQVNPFRSILAPSKIVIGQAGTSGSSLSQAGGEGSAMDTSEQY